MNDVSWTNFTINFSFSGGTGNVAPTYTLDNIARYSVTNNVCHVYIAIDNHAGGTPGAGTGALMIDLPVQAHSTYAPLGATSACGRMYNGGNTYICGITINPGDTTCKLTHWISSTSQVLTTGADQNNIVRDLELEFFYEVE